MECYLLSESEKNKQTDKQQTKPKTHTKVVTKVPPKPDLMPGDSQNMCVSVCKKASPQCVCTVANVVDCSDVGQWARAQPSPLSVGKSDENLLLAMVRGATIQRSRIAALGK